VTFVSLGISLILDSLTLCIGLAMDGSPSLKSNMLARVLTESSSAPAVSSVISLF